MQKRLLFVLLTVVTVLIVISGCGQNSTLTDSNSNAAGTAENDLNDLYLRSGQSGGIEINMLWVTPSYVREKGNPAGQVDPEKNLVFYISMTTHSGDLLQYDLANLSTLLTDGKNIKPNKWEFTNRDAHHPEGVLVFPGSAETVELPLKIVINGLANGPEVSFVWNR